MNLAELSKEIAIEAHKGQKRRDGVTDYVTHPIAVAEKAKELLDKYFLIIEENPNNALSVSFDIRMFNLINRFFVKSSLSKEEFIQVVQAVAFMHDIFEESKTIGYSYVKNKLEENNIPAHLIELVLKSVQDITRIDGESYLDYILTVKENVISTLAKIPDIRHNLSCQPKKENVEKYRLAEYILLN